MSFADLGLSEELLNAIADSGYDEPTPIQSAVIPSVLMGKDLIGIAQTGTGKTAGFVLPMLDILHQGRSRARMPRSMILEPTRELAMQVADNFDKYGKYHPLSMALLIGGVQMGDQVKALEKGVDVLIATPGRLMDLFGRGKIMLNDCNLLVIDEADRMLDMGFIPDIEEICTKLPKQRQTLLFSATMPPPIQKLSQKFLNDPKRVEVARPATANINIEQRLVETRGDKKRDALKDILRHEEFRNAIVFCNRKTTVRELASSLKRSGFSVGQIQGDMEQAARIAEFDRFKAGDIKILVASDVAARGLDVKDVSHVINFDVPWQPDDYIHRIGRTGRAGATGIAITLATREDSELVERIEKLTGHKIPRVGKAEQVEAEPKPQPEPKPERERKKSEGRKPKAAKAESPEELRAATASTESRSQSGGEVRAFTRRRGHQERVERTGALVPLLRHRLGDCGDTLGLQDHRIASKIIEIDPAFVRAELEFTQPMALLVGQPKFRVAEAGKTLGRPVHQHSLDAVKTMLRPNALHDALLLVRIFDHLIDRIGRARAHAIGPRNSWGGSSSGDCVKLARALHESLGVIALRDIEIMALERAIQGVLAVLCKGHPGLSPALLRRGRGISGCGKCQRQERNQQQATHWRTPSTW